MTAALAATTLNAGHDPNDYFNRGHNEARRSGGNGRTPDRPAVRGHRRPRCFAGIRDSRFEGVSLPDLWLRPQTNGKVPPVSTVAKLCRSYEAEGKVAGHGAVLLVESVAQYDCDKTGDIPRNCPMPTKNIIGRYTQRKAPRDNNFAATSLGTHTSLADGDQKLAVNFSDNFDHFFCGCWLPPTPSFPSSNGMMVLVNRSAAEHVLDDELLFELKGRMTEIHAVAYTQDNCNYSTSKRELRGTTIGSIPNDTKSTKASTGIEYGFPAGLVHARATTSSTPL